MLFLKSFPSRELAGTLKLNQENPKESVGFENIQSILEISFALGIQKELWMGSMKLS